MNLLKQTIAKIMPLDEAAITTIRTRLAEKLPSAGSFGVLAEILCQYAGITGQTNPVPPKKCTIIACADHGVAEMKISAYPPETTVQMTKNYLISKGAVANALANFSGADLYVVDMGVAAPLDNLPGLIERKIAFGTQNCAKGPAMTRTQAIRAVETGIALAEQYAAAGYRCFLPGEMGIANTTSSASIVAVCCNLTPEKATGRGTNISDERLKVKIEVVRQALAVNHPDPADGLDILAKVGGFELGCIAGLILGAAAHRAFVVLDGFNTGAAALIAAALCPLSCRYLMGSHLAAEPAHQHTLEQLGIHPYMDMQFCLGEATGSSIVVNLLDAAIKAYAQLEGKIPPFAAPVPSGGKRLPENFAAWINSLPALDHHAMESCQLYIDNLTKPIHSLGALEAIAVKIAGVTGQKKPAWMKKAIFIGQSQLKKASAGFAFAQHANAALRFLGDNVLPKESLCGGIAAAHAAIEAGQTLLGFCDETPVAQTAATAILTAYAAGKYQNDADLFTAIETNETIAAMTGVILGAAKERGIVVLDGITSQTAALCAVAAAPSVTYHLIVPEYAETPFTQLLRTRLAQPAYFTLHAAVGGCRSAIGMKLVDAAMHMLHDMKTFEEAAVAVADDGPGAARQKAKS